MGEKTSDDKESGALLKVLTAHYHALVSARSDETVLTQYAALLRFLKSRSAQFLQYPGHAKHRVPERSRLSPTITENELRAASLDDLEKLVSDERTSRIDLEFIAIQRFSVPRGSMRSFSNKQMLVDKLRTLIGNERTHETIGAVARGQDKQRSDS
jgi:hypothetical protein